MTAKSNTLSTGQDSAAVLVARFLRSNNYTNTLDAFLSEAGLPADAGSVSPGQLTIEKIIEEKHVFDLSRNFEKTNLDKVETGWASPAPSIATVVEGCGINSNVLTVALDEVVANAEGDSSTEGRLESTLVVASADRQVHRLTELQNPALKSTRLQAFDSPILCFSALDETYLLAGSMSGKLSLIDLSTSALIEERNDHKKYIVRLQSFTDDNGIWIATAGWDSKIFIYRILDKSRPTLNAPCAKIELKTNPEAVCFVHHPDLADPILVVSRRDSTFLLYYALPPAIPSSNTGDAEETCRELPMLGKQNLAPHSNGWIAFTPSSMAISPNAPDMLAVATSHTPHMKVIIVKLLLPKTTSSDSVRAEASAQETLTQTSQARAELAQQDREDAAILTQCNTMAPQSHYSTPELVWRPDGSGVWVNGDDGAVRGIEANSGKVVSVLRGAHEPGTKVRCLWAGRVKVAEKTEEWIVSGGFDRRLVLWKPGP